MLNSVCNCQARTSILCGSQHKCVVANSDAALAWITAHTKFHGQSHIAGLVMHRVTFESCRWWVVIEEDRSMPCRPHLQAVPVPCDDTSVTTTFRPLCSTTVVLRPE